MDEAFRIRENGTSTQRRRLIALAALMMAAVSLACGGPVVSFIDRLGTSSGADYAYPPSNVKQLARADLILRGSVLEIVDDGVKLFATAEPTPDDEDAWVDERSMFWYSDQSAPMIRVDVRMDELIYARPPIELEPGSVVSLSFWDTLDEYAVPTPAPWLKRDWPEVWRRMRMVDILPRVGDERLFLLWDQDWSPVVMDYYDPLFGAYSILDLSGSEVMLNSSPPIPIDITENTAPAAFLEELKAAIQEQ